ncbi:MAG: pyrroline-5-carboxylate reductase [Melioribacteraceae bacterium]|jgi:pyrroline-5-carboxylate reductase|nr:pyrroline-5-carboxylate reductase [Melioribacteraceae bacterium]WKZ68664.1 MAG: pyrroline-5-carboxylate reductase [Melioribacteraceae bacterium]
MNNQNKIAILGGGNIGFAIARGLSSSGKIKKGDILITRRNKTAISDARKEGFNISTNNVEAVKNSSVIVIAVTPQQLNSLISEIKNLVNPRRHIIFSIVSGVSIKQIKKLFGKNIRVVRVMPNTAIAIRESMTCISSDEKDRRACDLAVELFNNLGETIVIKEELMVPATALCACGTAFFLRAVRAASQGGIEIGFHAEEALFMAAQTAKGAASMLIIDKNHPEREVDKVTTPMGCTIAGLNQMEHHGFSSSLIKGITVSAEKAKTLYSTD